MASPADAVENGRAAAAKRAWRDAHAALALADRAGPLGADDLELLATAAYMLGRDDEYAQALERAHHAHRRDGDELRAVRCAFWIVVSLMLRGQAGRASGWQGRARRLVAGRDCAERGYLLTLAMVEHAAAGDHDAALAAGAEAMAIGERFGDADLFALTAQDQGTLLVRLGRVADGLALLDEAMVAVTAGELSPIVNGFVYCGAITGCQAAYEPRRGHEWTAALTRWCEQQPDMVSFTGTCLVHRAEILQLHGAWPEALDEARRAAERSALAANEARGGRGALPPGRAPPPARPARSRGGGLPRRAGARVRATAGSGAAAAGAGQARGRRRGDPPPDGRGHRARGAGRAAPRPGRDRAGGRRRRRGARGLPGARGDRRALDRPAAERGRRPRARRGRPRGRARRAGRWSRCGGRGGRGRSSRRPTRPPARAS